MNLTCTYRVLLASDVNPGTPGWYLDLHPDYTRNDGVPMHALNVSWVGYPIGNWQQMTSVFNSDLLGQHDFGDPNFGPDDFIRHNYFGAARYHIIITLFDEATITVDPFFNVITGGQILDQIDFWVQVGPEAPPFDTHSLRDEVKYDFNGLKPFHEVFGIEPDPSDPDQNHPDLQLWGGNPQPPMYNYVGWTNNGVETDWTHEGVDVTDDCRLKFQTARWGSWLWLNYSDQYQIEFDELSYEICSLPDPASFPNGYYDNFYNPPLWVPGCEFGFTFYGRNAPPPFGPTGSTLTVRIEDKPSHDGWRWCIMRECYTSGTTHEYPGDYDPVAHRWVKVTKTGYDHITVSASPDRQHWTEIYSHDFVNGCPQGVPPNEWFPYGKLMFYSGTDWYSMNAAPLTTDFVVIDNINCNGGPGCGSPPVENCKEDIADPEIVKVTVSCADAEVTVKATPYSSKYKQSATEWIIKEKLTKKVVLDVMTKPESKHKFTGLDPGNYTVEVCYFSLCDKACSEPYPFCVPCPCGGDLADFSELRLGPLVSLEDHKKALVDFETKFNQLVKALRGS